MPFIGAHVSIAGGVEKAALRAQKQGCEVMQIFVQAPQQYTTPKTTIKEINLFKASLKNYSIIEVYAHAPYLVNLAASNNRIRYSSINLIRNNLKRASDLDCKYLMTHIGSYGTQTKKQGLNNVIKSITHILEDYNGTCKLLLELSAGSGNIIGAQFQEIHKLLTALKKFKIKVCMDTAHIFASGYDLTNNQAIQRTIDAFDHVIGLRKLALIHLNDSLLGLGSKKDRHADIGSGKIGIDNLALILNHLQFVNINMILETPGNETRRLKDLNLLKSLRKQSKS